MSAPPTSWNQHDEDDIDLSAVVNMCAASAITNEPRPEVDGGSGSGDTERPRTGSATGGWAGFTEWLNNQSDARPSSTLAKTVNSTTLDSELLYLGSPGARQGGAQTAPNAASASAFSTATATGPFGTTATPSFTAHSRQGFEVDTPVSTRGLSAQRQTGGAFTPPSQMATPAASGAAGHPDGLFSEIAGTPFPALATPPRAAVPHRPTMKMGEEGYPGPQSIQCRGPHYPNPLPLQPVAGTPVEDHQQRHTPLVATQCVQQTRFRDAVAAPSAFYRQETTPLQSGEQHQQQSPTTTDHSSDRAASPTAISAAAAGLRTAAQPFTPQRGSAFATPGGASCRSTTNNCGPGVTGGASAADLSYAQPTPDITPNGATTSSALSPHAMRSTPPYGATFVPTTLTSPPRHATSAAYSGAVPIAVPTPQPAPHTAMAAGSASFFAVAGVNGTPEEREEAKRQVLAAARDQSGCRMLQRLLEMPWDSPEVQEVFAALYPALPELMSDPYGNFLVQKLLDVAPDPTRLEITRLVAPRLALIATTPHGTFAAQKLVDSLRSDSERVAVCEGLAADVVAICTDHNGAHVVQKVVAAVGPSDRAVLVDAVTREMATIANNRYGTCIVQRCLERSVGHAQQFMTLAAAVGRNVTALLLDPFGNYVVQRLVDQCPPQCSIVNGMVERLVELDGSRHTAGGLPGAVASAGALNRVVTSQFSSKAVERALMRASPRVASAFASRLLEVPGLLAMAMTDQFGNFIVQTMLGLATTAFNTDPRAALADPRLPLEAAEGDAESTLAVERYSAFVTQVVERLPSIRQFGFGKKMEARAENAMRQMEAARQAAAARAAAAAAVGADRTSTPPMVADGAMTGNHGSPQVLASPAKMHPHHHARAAATACPAAAFPARQQHLQHPSQHYARPQHHAVSAGAASFAPPAAVAIYTNTHSGTPTTRPAAAAGKGAPHSSSSGGAPRGPQLPPLQYTATSAVAPQSIGGAPPPPRSPIHGPEPTLRRRPPHYPALNAAS